MDESAIPEDHQHLTAALVPSVSCVCVCVCPSLDYSKTGFHVYAPQVSWHGVSHIEGGVRPFLHCLK